MAPARPIHGFRRPSSFGGVPPVTLRLLIATGLTTLGCVISAHLGLPQILEAFVLQPAQVLPGGKAWKLLSYLLFEGLDPLGFLLDLVVLYFFGAWFERTWGPRRFISFYALSGLLAGLFVALIGLVSPAVAVQPYYGIWPVMEALTVAMGLLEPDMQIYFYFLFPLPARVLMYASWGLIALFMIFHGSPVPYLTAVGGALAGLALSVSRGGPRQLWLRFRAAQIERQLRRRSRHLTVVPPPNGEDDPKRWLH